MTAGLDTNARARSLEIDQRVILYRVPWWYYEALLELRGESSVPRFTYLERSLEIMTPSLDHEDLKKWIARLFEAYVYELGLPCRGLGSWTIRDPNVERGLEPDECYVRREFARETESTRPTRPDLAIEVIWTHGGLDKLEVYRKLGVREVWMWRDASIHIHALEGESYVPKSTSAIYPEVDVALIAKLLEAETQSEALRKLQALLRSGKTKKASPKKKPPTKRKRKR